MKVCYIDIKKKTAKMAVTMKSYTAFEATDILLSPNQKKFICVDHLKTKLEFILSKFHIDDKELNEIMKEIEQVSESR